MLTPGLTPPAPPIWLMVTWLRQAIIDDAASIDAAIHCTPRPRAAARSVPQATLGEVRAKVEKHLKNTYFKQVQAPVGVAPQLVAWMELN
jgi:hypothetical protein